MSHCRIRLPPATPLRGPRPGPGHPCSGQLRIPPAARLFPGSGRFMSSRLLMSSRRRKGISCSSGCLGFMLSTFFSFLGENKLGVRPAAKHRDTGVVGHRDLGTETRARRDVGTRAWLDTGAPGPGEVRTHTGSQLPEAETPARTQSALGNPLIPRGTRPRTGSQSGPIPTGFPGH